MSFEPMVKYKFHGFNIIFRFTPIFYNMYMNGSVVVRIEHKSKTKYYKQCRHNSNIICILWNNAAKIQTIFHSSKHFSDYLQLFGYSQLQPITPSVTCHMDFGKIHFSLFPAIQFHIITRNIDHNSICISISIIIFPVSHPKFLIQDYRNQIFV